MAVSVFSDKPDRRDVRSFSSMLVGALLIAVAGYALIGSVFLPWTSINGAYVVGGQSGVRSFTGRELITDCADRTFPGQCVFEDRSQDPEIPQHSVLAGDWALAFGVALATIGAALAFTRSRGRRTTMLLAAGWMVAFAALAFGVATIVQLVGGISGGDGLPSVEVSVIVAAASPVLALVGLTAAQNAHARQRSIADVAMGATYRPTLPGSYT